MTTNREGHQLTLYFQNAHITLLLNHNITGSTYRNLFLNGYVGEVSPSAWVRFMRICFPSAPTSMQQPKPGYKKSTLNGKTQFKHIFYESKRGCQATSSRAAYQAQPWQGGEAEDKPKISQTSSGQNFHEPCARRCKSHHNKSEVWKRILYKRWEILENFQFFQIEKTSEKETN